MTCAELLLHHIHNSSQCLLSCVRLLAKQRPPLPLTPTNEQECCILCNGPGLEQDKKHPKYPQSGSSVLCVNSFAYTEEFHQLQPSLYAIADPLYWENPQEYPLLGHIAQKTGWPMTLFLPLRAKKFSAAHALANNQHISVQYTADAVLQGYPQFTVPLIQKQWGSPPILNVLAYALMVGIWKKIDTIYIFGANHNWFQTLTVAANNVPTMADQHYSFTGDAHVTPYMTHATGAPYTMAETLALLAQVFKTYETIQKVALKNNVRIINASEQSCIDAFPRHTLGT